MDSPVLTVTGPLVQEEKPKVVENYRIEDIKEITLVSIAQPILGKESRSDGTVARRSLVCALY